MLHINHIEYSDLLLFSVLIDVIMYVFLAGQKSRHGYSTKLFLQFILSIIAAGVCEAFAWIVAVPGSEALRLPHYIGNFLFFTFNILPAALGLRYLDYLIYVSKERNRKRFALYLLPVFLNLGFLIANLLDDGLLFSVDANNEYHRGIATYIGNIFTLGLAMIVVMRFLKHKNMITGRITQAMLVLTALPIAGVVLQMLFYGLSLAIPAYSLALFITFLLMERNELLKDPLTLLNSRAHMENRLQYKLKSREPFTAIMIDVNDFQKINDIYGRTVGDEVLKDISRILYSSANFEDFICRFGGDEFFVILESPRDIGHAYISRVDQVLLEYSAKKPFRTALSYGMVYVDHSQNYETEELVHLTGQLMCKDKENRRT
jgi:diguanylate cyclase (GGDEF)-like protein